MNQGAKLGIVAAVILLAAVVAYTFWQGSREDVQSDTQVTMNNEPESPADTTVNSPSTHDPSLTLRSPDTTPATPNTAPSNITSNTRDDTAGNSPYPNTDTDSPTDPWDMAGNEQSAPPTGEAVTPTATGEVMTQGGPTEERTRSLLGEDEPADATVTASPDAGESTTPTRDEDDEFDPFANDPTTATDTPDETTTQPDPQTTPPAGTTTTRPYWLTRSTDATASQDVTDTPDATDDAISVPDQTTYTIESGDNYWDIARKLYGPHALATLMQMIQDANPEVAPTALQVGQEIALPDPDAVRRVLQADAQQRTARAEAQRENEQQQAEEEAIEQQAETLQVPPGYRKYVIAENDSLYGIAQREYGDGNLWPLIHRANMDRIKDPDRLIVGTAILIPPPPDTE